MYYVNALFKHPEGAVELLEKGSKELQDEHAEFVRWSNSHGMARPVVTCLGRTRDENFKVGGVVDSLHIYDDNGTFHAVDYSIRNYGVEELKEILAYWDVRQSKTNGRVSYVHNLNHGTAPHLHVQAKPSPIP